MIQKLGAITALFKTNFRNDFPFDPQELFVFALMGVVCGFGGAGYVKLHRAIVHFFRNQKKLNAILQKKYVFGMKSIQFNLLLFL